MGVKIPITDPLPPLRGANPRVDDPPISALLPRDPGLLEGSPLDPNRGDAADSSLTRLNEGRSHMSINDGAVCRMSRA